MKRLIFIVGFVAWFLVGCYDDKGNYDYIQKPHVKQSSEDIIFIWITSVIISLFCGHTFITP